MPKYTTNGDLRMSHIDPADRIATYMRRGGGNGTILYRDEYKDRDIYVLASFTESYCNNASSFEGWGYERAWDEFIRHRNEYRKDKQTVIVRHPVPKPQGVINQIGARPGGTVGSGWRFMYYKDK